VLPEYLLHGLCVFLFLLATEWLSVVINAPLVAYHINRYDTFVDHEIYGTCMFNNVQNQEKFVNDFSATVLLQSKTMRTPVKNCRNSVQGFFDFQDPKTVKKG